MAAAVAPIRIQVGGRHFTTTKATLIEESGFFAALLSGRWDNALEDGSYFIDAEPTLFEHILRYLRRGVFPLFYDMAKGHDCHLYLSLLKEARYFQIPRLEDWLEKKRYLEAVQVTNMAQQYDQDSLGWQHSRVPADTTVEYYLHWGIKKVYICPQGILVHRGRPQACGWRCEAAKVDGKNIYEDSPNELSVRMLVMRKTVTFNAEVCVARDDEAEADGAG